MGPEPQLRADKSLPPAKPPASTQPSDGEHPQFRIGPPDLNSYGPDWMLFGPNGLRAGVSILVAYVLFYFLRRVVGTLFVITHLVRRGESISPTGFLLRELIPFFAMLIAASIIAAIEERGILDYNLAGPRRLRHFLSGLVAGFVALSVLVALLASGGWLHFGPVALSGFAILRYGLIWGCVFLVTGCLEEGMFRCYLQFTLTRGINFWWALSAVAGLCLYLMCRIQGNGVWGVYAVALLGLLSCFYLHNKHAARSAFWQATWVTSTAFGFLHTSNNGENWIGIFSAASIGFIFCVSIRLTGSAWWAIGCHAGWDWAETFLYGTADSGLTMPGHYLTSIPKGSVFWSGGGDGPEGSVLIIGVLLMLLAALLFLYPRKAPATPGLSAAKEISA